MLTLALAAFWFWVCIITNKYFHWSWGPGQHLSSAVTLLIYASLTRQHTRHNWNNTVGVNLRVQRGGGMSVWFLCVQFGSRDGCSLLCYWCSCRNPGNWRGERVQAIGCEMHGFYFWWHYNPGIFRYKYKWQKSHWETHKHRMFLTGKINKSKRIRRMFF